MNREHEGGQERIEAVNAANRSIDQAKTQLERTQSESALRKMGGWLKEMRDSRFLRGPAKRMAALFLGIPLSASAGELEAPPAPLPEDSVAMLDVEFANPAPEAAPQAEEEVDELDVAMKQLISDLHADHENKFTPIEREAVYEARYPETDEFYKWELTQVAKSIEGGQASPEYYARVGRPEWTPYQRALFADAPVGERFTELHPEYRDLSSQDFLEQLPEMIDTAKTEFRFSNQYRDLVEDAAAIFVADAPDMSPDQALETYKTLTKTIGSEVGLSKVVELTDALLAELPADHPIAKYAVELGMEQVKPLVGRSKKNFIHMDQANGELRVMRKIGDTYVVIESFPAIGGPLNAPKMGTEKSGSEFVHVPEMTMTVAYVDRAKTSWTWNNSWVPAGASLREGSDGELEYQHPRTKKWYDLTGPDAGFFPDKDGKAIKPFDTKIEPMDRGLIRAATHKGADGASFVPKAWTKEELTARNGGEVPTEWKWNDFGSTAIRLSVDGKQTNINIHSKPGEDTNDFLPGRTHGCFATFGDYVKALPDAYGIGSGSTVVVTTSENYSLDSLLK